MSNSKDLYTFFNNKKNILIYNFDLEDQKQKTIALTDFGLYLLSFPTIKIIKSFSWFELEKFQLIENIFTLNFKSNIFSFQSIKKVQEILNNFAEILQRFFSKEELELIEFNKYFNSSYHPSELSTFLRFKYYLNFNKINISEKNLNLLKNFFQYSNNIFDTSLFESFSNLSNSIINILPLYKNINTIIIKKQNQFDPFLFTSDLFLNCNNISNFIIHSNDSNNFEKFINNISNNNRKTSIGISFNDFELTSNQLNLFLNLIENNKIFLHYLGLNCCLNLDSFSFFINNILKVNKLSQLSILSLDNTNNLDVLNILPYISNILILSLINCNIEISNLFQKMNKIPLLRINSLNISNNYCLNIIDETLKINSSLITIIANEVSWDLGCLQSFIRLICQRNIFGINLSLSNSKICPDEWIKVFHFFELTNYQNLKSFIWDNNPISKSIFDFLEKNKNLEYLSLNYCLNLNFLEPILYFTNYLSLTNNLKVLKLKGNDKFNLGNKSLTIFSYFHLLKNIEEIDITNSNCGNEGITLLFEEIKNLSNLKKIYLEGFNPKTIEPFKIILNYINKFEISYPEIDLNNFSNNKNIEKIKNSFLKFTNQKYLNNKSLLDGPFLLTKNLNDSIFTCFYHYKDILKLNSSFISQIIPLNDENLNIKINLEKRIKKIIKKQILISNNEFQQKIKPQKIQNEIEINNSFENNNNKIENNSNFDPFQSAKSLPIIKSEDEIDNKQKFEKFQSNWNFPNLNLNIDQKNLWNKYEELFSGTKLFRKIKEDQ